jgi:DNA (cytosine-5)-methyltransferase 3A
MINIKELTVCSLFDGMSCLQIALNRIGLKPTKYYASEIDKYAIQVTMANFHKTIQLGDVRNVKGSDLGFIDILVGGVLVNHFHSLENAKE